MHPQFTTPLPVRVDCVCPVCGKAFQVYRSQFLDGVGKYCSRSCHRAAQCVDPVTRFWSKIKKTDGCWEWQGTIRNGYGTLAVQHTQNVGAHRFSYALHYGAIPDGLSVCHRCDNRRCVRPDHLFLGTAKDNALDASEKGRLPTGNRHPARLRPDYLRRGETNPKHKLTAEDVATIRSLFQADANRADLARQFGVSWTTIQGIITHQIWQHLP